MPLFVQEAFVNLSKGYRYGESDVYESFADTPGELFRYGLQEYGRCTGKVYVDTETGPMAVGWVYLSRVPYDDVPETYLREVWVTVHDAPPTVSRETHYHAIGGTP